MGRTRGLRGLVALAALATAVSPVTSGAQVSRCPDEARRARADGWITLRQPAFSEGPAELRAWAASPFVDGFLLATNGDGIARSIDGGCNWEEVYTPGTAIGEVKLVKGTQSIFDVAIPPSPPGRLGYTVYGVISDVDGTRVVTSDDLGETWNYKTSAGLPPIVNLHGMWVSPNPRTAFVLVDSRTTLTSAIETTLYVTRDAGATFAPVTRGLQPKQYTNVGLDPIDPALVWAWDDDDLFRSTDGGLSFYSVDVPGPISTVDVLHYPAFSPSRVIAYRKNEASASVSSNGGLTWTPEKMPGRVTGSTNLYSVDAVAMASDRGVHLRAPRFIAGGLLLDVSPRGIRVTELAFALGGQVLALYGRAGNDILVRRFTQQLRVIPPPKLPPLPPVDLRGGAVVKRGPTTLKPETATVTLRPGQTAQVPYTLDMAPVPTPLDIFFATDSTGSMRDLIASLRRDLQDIIDDLGKSGIDVWFGIGDFRDYPIPAYGQPGDHPYIRRRPVGPIDEELEAAIESIQTGGGVNYDSALAATYQAATGAGQRVVEQSGEGGWWIRPGQGAEWRPDSLKVVVIAADVRTRDPQTDPGYPGPSFGKVISALNRLGIEHVGLAVGRDSAQAAQTLSKVSKGTGTLAPEGGVDCDDDGETDVVEGAPLVCELPVSGKGTNLLPAMVGLLRSLKDLQPVGMALTGDRRAAKVASTPLFDDVNVKERNLLPFKVQASCATDMAGKSYDVGVQAHVAERPIASATLKVVCEPLVVPPPELPLIPPPAPVVAAAVAPIAPPPPPAPVPQPQPQPNPNPNPNPNPQPAVNAQVGMAYQEQAEVQLALAYAEMEIEDSSDELAIVGLALGSAMAAGCAVGLRRRSRHAVAKAYYE